MNAFLAILSLQWLQFEIWALVLYVTIFYLVAKGRLPKVTTGGVQALLTSLNSRGGNIFVLLVLNFYFYYNAHRMYFIVIDKIKDGTIASDNGIALNGLTFAAGAFSGVAGALLKTMSPEATDAPTPAAAPSAPTP